MTYRCVRRCIAREDPVQQKRRSSGTNGWTAPSASRWVHPLYTRSFPLGRVKFYVFLITFFLPSSHASFRQSTLVRQVHTSDAIQVSDCSAAQRRAARLWTHKRLHFVATAPIQEAGIEKLSKHLSTVVHTPFVKHTVRV